MPATPDTDFAGVVLFVILTGLANLASGLFWGLLTDKSSRYVILLTATLSIGIFLFSALFHILFEPNLSSNSVLAVYLLLYFLLAVCKMSFCMPNTIFDRDINLR